VLPAGPAPTTTTSHWSATRITRAQYAARRAESTGLDTDGNAEPAEHPEKGAFLCELCGLC
jgi:hypothetical protein